jgi:hypothetical protein
MTPIEIASFTLLPLVIAAVFTLAARAIRGTPVAETVVGIGLAAAWMAGHWAVLGRPEWPIRTDWHWLFFAAPIAALIGSVRLFAGHRLWTIGVDAMLRLALVGGLVWLMTRARVAGDWSAAQGWTWRVGLTAGGVMLWYGLRIMLARGGPVRAPLVAATMALITTPAMVMAYHARLAQAPIALGCALLGMALARIGQSPRQDEAASPRASRGESRGAWPGVLAILLTGLWSYGCLFATDDTDGYRLGYAAIGIALTPAVLLLGAIGPIRRRSRLVQGIIQLALVVVLSTGAMIPLMLNYTLPGGGDDAYDPYGDDSAAGA